MNIHIYIHFYTCVCAHSARIYKQLRCTGRPVKCTSIACFCCACALQLPKAAFHVEQGNMWLLHLHVRCVLRDTGKTAPTKKQHATRVLRGLDKHCQQAPHSRRVCAMRGSTERMAGRACSVKWANTSRRPVQRRALLQKPSSAHQAGTGCLW